jgi:hypothetical protein
MVATNINLGCGPVFVEGPEWINLDFTASSPAVRQANLLGRLPLESDAAQLVYASHFSSTCQERMSTPFCANAYAC